MSLVDRFLNAIKLNDDFDDDDDFLDDDDFEDTHKEKPAERKRFFSRFDDDDEDDDEEEDFESDSVSSARGRRNSRRSSDSSQKGGDTSRRKAESAGRTARSASNPRTVTYSSRSSQNRESREDDRRSSRSREDERGRSRKNASSKRKTGVLPMEVNVVRPSSMEDTREIADTLMENCTVVLNLEGLDIDVAQRVIDFTCGVCYSLHGNLQKISSYIFILTPEDVDISGDFQSILDGTFDLPSMRGDY